MPILNQQNKEDVAKYEAYISQFDGASLMQSLNWAKVKFNWMQEGIYIEENGSIIAAITLLLQKVPHTNSYFMYAPRGPVCDLNNVELVKKLVKEVELLKDKYKIFLLKFDPNEKYSQELENKYKEAGFFVLNKKVSANDLIQPLHDMVLTLDGYDAEELMKNFAEKTRYNIRLAKRKGVEVYYSRQKEDLGKFYELYKITTVRDNIGCRSYEYFEKMLEAYDENHLRIYIAKHEDDYLSAAIAINYGKELFYLYGASSNEKRNLMPNYLMQWEMIKWGLETECKKYNFGGVLHLDEQNGLYKFKIGFCKKDGITEYIGEIDKVYDKKMYFLYTKTLPLLKKINMFFVNLKNKK
ncbi:MAG: peptidoglycan bridge formation glycyltransferase FemA/FemB family protein [Clostridia bacterium]|nr:peptidoglycan bridge formation glycyltransferase FemA/FemB family protein [Clostridia bacterium]